MVGVTTWRLEIRGSQDTKPVAGESEGGMVGRS